MAVGCGNFYVCCGCGDFCLSLVLGISVLVSLQVSSQKMRCRVMISGS
jgi:hypothetical protein